MYKQKVKHLLYEHQNSISELKGEGVVSNKLMQKEHAELENELCKGMCTLKVDIKEQELSNENLIKGLKLVRGLLALSVNMRFSASRSMFCHFIIFAFHTRLW